MKQIVCSFSGGETSAYMAIKLKEKHPDTVYTFANTGLETESTLEFVDAVDNAYGLGVVWLEAVTNPDKGKGMNYKVVDFKTASRNGEPFEAQIKKYGLSNPVRKYCTRDLKSTILDKWANNHHPDHIKAIGIRIDELDRVNPEYKENGLCYPLAFWWPANKQEINSFWREQPFRLTSPNWATNCTTCYKKSFNKLAWIAKIYPERFDFFERMEKEHCHTNSVEHGIEEPIRIFRNHRTVADIREMAKTATEPRDDAQNYEVNGDLFGFDDMSYESDMCGSESCEAFQLTLLAEQRKGDYNSSVGVW